MIFCDIETDGLNPTKIWCVGVAVDDQDPYLIFNKEDFCKLYETTKEEHKWCFHNGIGFDVPALRKVWGCKINQESILDTLILGRLADPSRVGGHSLRSYGDVLGYSKGDHEDWSQYSEEMGSYCLRDVELLRETFGYITEKLSGFAQESLDLEHQVAWIIKQQQDNGFLFNHKEAWVLSSQFKTRLLDIESELHKVFPPIITERWSEKTGRKLKDHVEVFNVGSRKQIAKRLLQVGVQFKDTTEKGNVIVDEAALSPWADKVPEAKLVLEYLLLQKRKSQVDSWIDAQEADGRVHGRVRTNGAVTGRMTHNSPNMAQVPSVGNPWGKECRSLWIVPEGFKLVGADASGLELRMLAHYMDDAEYTYELLNGDIHTRNQEAAGLPTRNAAKTFIYAFLYGAGDEKIGSIVGKGKAAGRKLKEDFLRNVPSLGALRERVEAASGRGYLTGLDGRKLYVRSQHAALNTLLQGAGAIVMKKALCILDQCAIISGIDYKFTANIHDEWQAEVREDQAERFGRLAVQSIQAAGLEFNLRCPLDGEYKVGNTWADTH